MVESHFTKWGIMEIPETRFSEFVKYITEVWGKLWTLACNYPHPTLFLSWAFLTIIAIAVLRNILKPPLLLFILSISLIIVVIGTMLELLLLASYIPLSYIGKWYWKQFFMNRTEYYELTNHLSNKYAAILISNNQSSSMIKCCVRRYWKNNTVNAATIFIPLLIKHFQKHNLNYKIVQSITKEDFNNIINDSDCDELYLIGHGSRGRFKLSETIVNYSEYINIKTKKQIVSQLHCNGVESAEANISLTELLSINQEDSFLNKRTNNIVDLFWYCWKMSRK